MNPMKNCSQICARIVLSIVPYVLPWIAAAVEIGPLWNYNRVGDPPLSLISLPDVTGDGLTELVVGYDSGGLLCLDPAAGSAPAEVWSTTLQGTILALLATPDSNGDGFPEVVAGTDLGQVAKVSAGGATAGQIVWSFYSTCNVSCLTLMDDTDGDGIYEVAVGGADHRVHMLSGKTGTNLWSRFFDVTNGDAYVARIVNAGDLNGDLVSDLFVRTWAGGCCAISGVDGSDIWPSQSGSGLTSVLARTEDLNHDGRSEFLTGGNNGILYLCSGGDGSAIWSCALERPLREVLVTEDVTGDGIFDCFAVTAGGRVACISGASSGGVTPQWTAEVSDVCRSIVSPGDIDRDGKPDVIASAEDGTVTAFSGASGGLLWQWTGGDVVPVLSTLDDINGDEISEVAAGLLNGDLVLLSGVSNDSTGLIKPYALKEKELDLLKPVTSMQTVEEVPILLYHDVLPEAFYSCCSISKADFEAQMDVLVEGGFTAVSLDEIADWIEGTGTLPDHPVCITFDGPYDGHHTHAFQILQERGLFATSYITADWIGTANHVDWHQLRQLEDAGVMDIQNHTLNHPDLTTVSSDEVIRQVSGCNDSIFRHLGGKVSLHHAYPGGAHNSSVHQILRDMGMRTATTVEARKATRSDDLMALPRYPISRTTSLGSFKQMVGFKMPPLPPLPYEFVGTVGTGWSYLGYGDLDAEGKLWICDYSAGTVRVFLQNSTEAAFSPITHGLKEDNTSIRIEAPSGVAITPGGEAIITIADYTGETQYFGLFRYRASDGQALTGNDLAFRPGDVDCDANGLVYLLAKVIDEWHVYTPDFEEITGSPFGPGTPDHVQRGISVRPDSSRVYVISESSGNVRVWQGNATISSASYVQGDDLVDDLSPNSGGVDVMDDGTILVGYDEEGLVRAFDAEHHPLGDLKGGTPTLITPRGVAFTPDGSILWVISRSGFVQRWERTASSEIAHWSIYY
jgi:peptidoglycan/xylan/chitin deacetylase (PgdA/CDA1 family)/DNA-binding beta-propeller fold protein YncE